MFLAFFMQKNIMQLLYNLTSIKYEKYIDSRHEMVYCISQVVQQYSNTRRILCTLINDFGKERLHGLEA